MKAEKKAEARQEHDSLANYLAAEIPRQFTILGQRLLPFSLWHMNALMRFGSGFLNAEPITQADVLMGVLLCCQTWEEGLASLTRGSISEQLAEWGESIGEDLVRENKGTMDELMAGKAEEFAEYLREGCGRPELLPSDGDSRTPGAPLVQILKLFLIRDMRLSRSEAMNYPFALACHDFFAFHEQKGAAKIANYEESLAMADHEESAESDEMLKACLDALPGSVPITDEDKAKVKTWNRRTKRKKCRLN